MSTTILAGIHVGCFELFARDGIRSVADLKGRTVGIQSLESPSHVFLSAMATLVGLDPNKDFEWVTSAKVKPIELFAEGKIDAFLGFPSEPQRLRAQNIGHVIVNSAQDRPWSQYFLLHVSGKSGIRPEESRSRQTCGSRHAAGNGSVRERAGSYCAAYGRKGVHGSLERRHSNACGGALQPLARPEDTIRFYALRLREAGMLKSNPAKLIADGTNWRFLSEFDVNLEADSRRSGGGSYAYDRRDLLLTGVYAASIALLWSATARLRAEQPNPPPETTTIRLAKNPSICIAPQYVVSDLLNAEGFTNFVYVDSDAGVEQTKAVAKGNIDFTLHFSGPLLLEIDRGASITVVAGVHVGCFELFAKNDIRSFADLKGRTVGQQGVGSSPHVFISAMATLVGLDPAKDIEWVTSASVKPIELFAEGKIDAFLGFPPEPQRLRAQNIGHIIVNSALDRPWSQHFCCMLAATVKRIAECD